MFGVVDHVVVCPPPQARIHRCFSFRHFLLSSSIEDTHWLGREQNLCEVLMVDTDGAVEYGSYGLASQEKLLHKGPEDDEVAGGAGGVHEEDMVGGGEGEEEEEKGWSRHA